MEGWGASIARFLLEEFYSKMLKLSVVVHSSLTDMTFDVAMATAQPTF